MEARKLPSLEGRPVPAGHLGPRTAEQVQTCMEQIQIILRRLAENDPTVTSLDLGQIVHAFNGDLLVQHVMHHLKKNTYVKDINLSVMGITDAGCAFIAEALEINSSITMLKLSNNQIGVGIRGDEPNAYHGTMALFEALRTNTSLQIIDMSGNDLGFQALVKLPEIMRQNKTLITLELTQSGLISEDSSQLDALTFWLRVNTFIAEINKKLAKGEPANKEIDKVLKALDNPGNIQEYVSNQSIQKKYLMELKEAKLATINPATFFAAEIKNKEESTAVMTPPRK